MSTPGANRRITVYGALNLASGRWFYRLGRRRVRRLRASAGRVLSPCPQSRGRRVRRARRRRGVYGALLLAAYDPAADLFRIITKCGTGFSDADLAALPARLAPVARPARPARVDARQHPDMWFEPGMVLEIISAELALSPTYTAAWGQIKEEAGLAMRFPRFTGRWRDDKAPDDATTTGELISLYRTAQRSPAGT